MDDTTPAKAVAVWPLAVILPALAAVVIASACGKGCTRVDTAQAYMSAYAEDDRLTAQAEKSFDPSAIAEADRLSLQAYWSGDHWVVVQTYMGHTVTNASRSIQRAFDAGLPD